MPYLIIPVVLMVSLFLVMGYGTMSSSNQDKVIKALSKIPAFVWIACAVLLFGPLFMHYALFMLGRCVADIKGML